MMIAKPLVAVSLTVMLVACGGGNLSLTEYAQRLDALATELGAQLEAGDVQMSTGTPTLDDAREVLTTAVAARAAFQADLTALDPPPALADLHADLVEVHAEIIEAQEAFVARAQTATGLEDLDQSTEAQAYRATVTESVTLCRAIRARLDTPADPEIFTEVPWIPGDIKEVVEVTFGC